jgi:hypothetical protein
MSGEGILRKIKRDVNYKVKTLHDEIMSEKNIPNEKDIEKKKRSKEAKKKAFQYVRISSEEI